MKIVQQPDVSGQELSKRFYLPGLRLRDDCPECGASVEREHAPYDYVSYPSGGVSTHSVYFTCPTCEHEWGAEYTLTITATASAPAPLTQEQKDAVLRYVLDPGCVKGFCEGLEGDTLALFPDLDERWPEYRRALEEFIEQEREKVGR
jgi:rRNA maturation protein Nop10